MAKHPHRLLLNQNKTWRCTLPNCRYFIHAGLAHVLPGQTSICWGCGEQFMLDEDALKEDMPHCSGCRAQRNGWTSPDEIGAIIEARLALAKAGVKSVEELNPTQRNTMKMMGIKLDALKDEVEVIEPEEEEHAPDCASWNGEECDCK